MAVPTVATQLQRLNLLSTPCRQFRFLTAA